MQNAYIERFNGACRRGVLDKYIFKSIDQVRGITQTWMDDYNHYRPHDSMRNFPSIKYAEINFLATSS